MMCFYYLLAAHLLGDFTFQTNKIAMNKNKNPKGVLVHVLIVSFFMLLFSVPFGAFMIIMVFLACISHYLIDLFKLKMKFKNAIFELYYFLFDQALHITILYFVAKFYNGNSASLLPGRYFIKLFVFLLFSIFFCRILNQYILKVIFSLDIIPFFIGYEKYIGDFTRFLSFLIFYLTVKFLHYYLLLIFLLVFISFYLYNHIQNPKLSESYLKLRLLLDVVVSLAGVLAFNYIY